MSPGWSLVIGTAELSADLSQSPAQGSVAPSPAPGAVSCRRHDGAIESAGSGLSILPTPEIQPWTAGCRFGSSIPQHGLGPSRGSPAAAPVPRFPSAGTSFSYVSGCRPDSSIPSTGSSCEPTYNRRVVSGHQSVSKRRSASGGRRPS